MTTYSSLSGLFSDVANSIREVNGDSNLMAANDFAQEIRDLGGGNVTIPNTTITVTPQVSQADSSGKITITNSASKTIVPSVTPGYVKTVNGATANVTGSTSIYINAANTPYDPTDASGITTTNVQDAIDDLSKRYLHITTDNFPAILSEIPMYAVVNVFVDYQVFVDAVRSTGYTVTNGIGTCVRHTSNIVDFAFTDFEQWYLRYLIDSGTWSITRRWPSFPIDGGQMYGTSNVQVDTTTNLTTLREISGLPTGYKLVTARLWFNSTEPQKIAITDNNSYINVASNIHPGLGTANYLSCTGVTDSTTLYIKGQSFSAGKNNVQFIWFRLWNTT